MANPDHLRILMEGVEAWNDWRKKDPTLSTDLTHADLGRAVLSGANLERANLNGAYLSSANLMWARLNNAVFIEANLQNATLDHARLIGASFRRANLRSAKLIGANLSKAQLTDASLQAVNLTNANLSTASLIGANLTDAILDNAILDHAELGATVFGNVNLANINGLEKVRHYYFSIISSTTMQISKGNIPLQFMRGCGLTDWEIEFAQLYKPELSNEEINRFLYKIYDMRAQQPIQISPLFISYSHSNTRFVDKLEIYLNEIGIRFWRDVHHATVGRLEKQIDQAIRKNPTVLLILSESSIKSDWVQHEVHIARELEKEIGRDVLCPISLDESWKKSTWPKRLMEQIMEYNILDFSNWENDHGFAENFRKLITGLDIFYK